MKMLVTGGTGFLGQKLVYRLVEMGHQVTVIGRNKKVGEKLKRDGVSFIQTDLREEERVIEACHQQDYVFHVAALSSPWGDYQEFYESNVVSTQHVIKGCKKHKVKRLIHVSTPSIYFKYEDRFNISEKDPLPTKFVNHYASTKFLAEKEIDKAFEEGLPVITIRPRALFGPDDTTIIPRLIKANEKGFIPLINKGKVLMDITYVENVVDALLLCMDSPKHTLGKKYNITNGEPVYLIDVLTTMFERLNEPFRTKEIPFKMAYLLAGGLEFISKTLLRGKEPVLTQYTAGVLAKSQTLDITEARKDLGYNPKVTIDEGINLFIDWWKKQNA